MKFFRKREIPGESYDWGYEIWWGNVPSLYLGKTLVVYKNKVLPLHYHERKYETIYCESGIGKVTVIEPDGTVSKFTMGPGQAIELPPMTQHRIVAHGCELLLFESSTYEPEDSIILE